MQIKIRDSIKKGFIWLTISFLFVKIFAFFTNIIFARFLYPDEFGLYAQAFIVSTIFLEFSSLGIDSFIVYKQKNASNYINSAFTLSLLTNLTLFFLIIFFSDNIAGLYFSGDVKLIKKLIIVLSVLYLFQPFRIISLGFLTANMQFNNITKANIISNFISGSISIIAAVKGAGVWTLVLYSILERIINIFVMMFYTKIKTSFRFDIKQFKEIFGYGIYITTGALVWYLILNLDIFIIGKYFGSYFTGIYSFSMKQAMLLVSIVGVIIAQVIFPTFSALQGIKEELRKAFIKTTKVLILIGIPSTFLLFIFAKEFITIVFGEKWTDAIVPFRILLLGLSTRLIFCHAPQLLRAIGRTDIDFKLGLIILPVIFFAVLYGVNYGINGVSFAVASVYFISSIFIGFISANLIGIKFKQIFIK